MSSEPGVQPDWSGIKSSPEYGLVGGDTVERLISVRELEERFGVPRSWVYEKVEAGALPHLKLGRHVRFVPAEIEAWLEQQRRPRP
jgi:excisionase family DNA binding protein